MSLTPEAETRDLVNVCDLISQQSQAHPCQIALIEGGEAITYRELERRVDGRCHWLAENGLKEGSLVAIHLPAGIDFVVILIAIVKAGMTAFPMDTSYPTKLQERILEKHQPQASIVGGGAVESVKSFGGRVLPVDTIDQHRVFSFPTKMCDGDQPAMVLLTSGSTGEPRAVLRSQMNILTPIQEVIENEFFKDSNPVGLLRSPVCHSGIVWEIFSQLGLGFQVVIASENAKRNSIELLKLIRRHRIQYMSLVPTQLTQLLALDGFKDLDFIRGVNLSGETLPVETKQAFELMYPNCLSVTYGCTESPSVATYKYSEGDSEAPILGIPNRTMDVRIIYDRRTSDDVKVGELHVGGSLVALGYLNDAEATTDRFYEDAETGIRYFRTGDRVSQDEDGKLIYHGRTDRLVQLRGFRVDLYALEQGLLGSEGVVDCAVVVASSPTGGRLIAYVVLGETASLDEVREAWLEQVPTYMIMAIWREVDELPRLINGKRDYERLREYEAEDGRNEEPLAQLDESESKVYREILLIWKRVLEIEYVGISDNFFKIGGDSINALEVTLACMRKFNTYLLVQTIYDHPRLSDFCDEIERLLKRGEDARVSAANVDASGTPIIWIHGLTPKSDPFKNPALDQPVYSFGHESEDGRKAQNSTIESMVDHCLLTLKEMQVDCSRVVVGGYCSGAIIALELARKLTDSGSTVKTVILEPSVSLARKVAGEPELADRLLGHARSVFQNPFTQRSRNLIFKLFRRKRIGRFVEKLVCRTYLILGLRIPKKLRFTYIQDIVYVRAARAYELRPLNTPVAVYHCERGGLFKSTQWSGLSTSEVSVKQIDGAGHTDCLRSPYAAAWSTSLVDQETSEMISLSPKA